MKNEITFQQLNETLVTINQHLTQLEIALTATSEHWYEVNESLSDKIQHAENRLLNCLELVVFLTGNHTMIQTNSLLEKSDVMQSIYPLLKSDRHHKSLDARITFLADQVDALQRGLEILNLIQKNRYYSLSALDTSLMTQSPKEVREQFHQAKSILEQDRLQIQILKKKLQAMGEQKNTSSSTAYLALQQAYTEVLNKTLSAQIDLEQLQVFYDYFQLEQRFKEVEWRNQQFNSKKSNLDFETAL